MLDTQVFFAKRETVPGTAVALIGTADAFEIQKLQITPIEGDVVRRSVDRGFAGAAAGLKTRKRNRVAFDVELAGSGAAITPTKWGQTLLGACLFGVPSVGATEVTYPLSNAGDGDALSTASFLETARHQGRGSRGNVVINFAEGAIPSLSFALIAQLVADTPMAAAAPGTVTLPTPPAGVEVNYLNTLVTFDGTVVGLRSLTIDLGMKPVFYSTTGGQAVYFDKGEDGDRRSAGFTAVFEMPDPAVKNYLPLVASGAPVGLSVVHGLVAGNIIDFGSTRAVLEDATYSVETNRVFLNVTGKFVPSAANNELTLKTR